MGLTDILAILRRRWILLLACIAAGLLAAGGAYLFTPKTYVSSTSLFVTATDARDAASLSQGAMYVQSQIRSYPAIITSPAVTQAVARDTGQGDAASLAKRVTAEVPTDSAIVEISTSASRPDQARDLARSFANVFAHQIEALETRQGSATSPIHVATIAEATSPTSPDEPRVVVYLSLGLVGGLVLGLLVAAARELTAGS